jgi:hypothetical protein
MPNIYNFFEFIHKKTGNWPGEDEGIVAKCRYAPELITDKDLENMPIEFKIAFFPEKITKEELYIDGNLQFGAYTWNDVKTLPENLRIKHSLNMEYAQIKVLPDGLRVGWHVRANNSLLDEIGKNVYIGGDLNVANTPLASMQANSGYGFSIRNEIDNSGGFLGGDLITTGDDDYMDDYD